MFSPKNWFNTLQESAPILSATSSRRRPNVFFVVAALFCFFHLFIFGFIASSSGEAPELIFLLALPVIFQVIGSWVLCRKIHFEYDVWNFFWFYLICMFCCLFSYLIAWGIDLKFNTWLQELDEWRKVNKEELLGYLSPLRHLSYLQYAPLLFIFILIFPCSVMTYRLLESPDGEFEKRQKSGIPPDEGWFSSIWTYGFLLKGMKRSVSTSPYWAFLFFFTIFLVIMYLFSFAFAIHDKFQLKAGQLPAFFMSKVTEPEDKNLSRNADNKNAGDRTLPENHDNKNSDGYSHTNNIQSNSDPPFTFYFEFDDHRLATDERPFDENKSDPNETNESWRKCQNNKRLKDLRNAIKAIKNDTRYGSDLTIYVEGQADGSGEKEHNYYLSAVRAQVMHSYIRDLDDGNEIVPIALGIPPPIDKQLGDLSRLIEGLLTKFRQLMSNDKTTINKELAGGFEDNIESIRRHKNRLPDERLSEDELKKLVIDLEEAIDNLANLSKQEMSENDDKKKSIIISGKEGERKKIISKVDEAKYAGGNANKRIVRVTLKKRAKAIPEYQKYELLDYIVYAITGPDYGDVFPRTRYAKFLCSFSNIVQAFFMVALFSLVLSLKKNDNSGKNNDNSGAPQEKEDGREKNTEGNKAAENKPSVEDKQKGNLLNHIVASASPPPARPASDVDDRSEPNHSDTASAISVREPKEAGSEIPASKSAPSAELPLLVTQPAQVGYKPVGDEHESDLHFTYVLITKAEETALCAKDNEPDVRLPPAESARISPEPSRSKAIVLNSQYALHPATEATGRIEIIEAPDDFKPEVVSDTDWIRIDGVATRTVVYLITANTGKGARVGVISVNSIQFHVVQDGSESRSRLRTRQEAPKR